MERLSGCQSRCCDIRAEISLHIIGSQKSQCLRTSYCRIAAEYKYGSGSQSVNGRFKIKKSKFCSSQWNISSSSTIHQYRYKFHISIEAKMRSHTKGLSPLLALQLFVERRISGQPRRKTPHFLANSSVTSQFLGSQGVPHTRSVALLLRVSQKAVKSWHNSSSSRSSPAWIRLSLMHGNGKTSSHG